LLNFVPSKMSTDRTIQSSPTITRYPTPQPGAPSAYVTTGKFLEAFGFGSLRDLPDLERFKAEDLLRSGQREDDLGSSLGLAQENVDAIDAE
jgi:hypothetical protein